MEIRLTKPELLKALAWTQGVVERRSTMPILGHCCLAANEKTVTVSATDLEVGVIVRQGAEVARSGKIAVPARALFDVVKELPDERLTLKALPNHWVEITAGPAHVKLVGLAADEFPAIPTGEKGDPCTIDAALLGKMIDKVVYAISTDETRFNLNGVFAELVDGGGGKAPQLRFVATDSHRLSYAERPVKGKWKIGKGAIIPRKGIYELRRLLDGGEGELTLQFGEKQLIASRGSVTLLIRLVDGQFPPYAQVIPKDHQRVVAVNREALRQGLKRAHLLTTERARGIVLTFSPGHLRVAVTNPDVGEAEEELPATYKGETFKWGVNCRYLLDLLEILEDEQAILELKNEVSPCVVRSEFDRGFLAIVMPMRV